jgi:hypothetical protein
VTVRIFVDGQRAGRSLAASTNKNKARVLAARRGAAQDVVNYVVPRVRADIRKAGKFGTRWTDGFEGRVTEGGGFVKISFTQKVPYWRVFQTGKVIYGKPLLWIPLSFAKDAQGKNARDFGGPLFRVDRKGKAPLLMTPGKPAQAKYFGKTSVKIPKKFHTLEIVRDGASKMRDFFSKRMKQGK